MIILSISEKIRNFLIPETLIQNQVNASLDSWTMLIDLSNESEKLTEDNALTFGSLYSVINILASDIASLPLQVFQSKNGQREKLGLDNKVAYLLTKKVNSRMTPYEFKAKIIMDMCIFGNHFSLMKFDRAGNVSQIVPLDPSVTNVFTTDTGQLFYKTTYNNEQIELMDYEVIHIKHTLTKNGLGVSPLAAIRLNAEAVNSGDVMNRSLLENNGIPKGIISVSGSLGKEAKDNVRKEWKRANSEAGNGVLVMDSGMEYKQLGQTQQDMDFLNGMNFNLERVAAAYRTPSHKLNLLDRATYSNVSEQNVDYISSALLPLVKNIEEVLNISLFTEKEQMQGFYIKFNFNNLLRSTPRELAETIETELRSGTLTIDEARELNERNPFNEEWSKVPYLTLNYEPLSNREPEGKEETND